MSAPPRLQIHIVEDHDEALPHIYRAIAKRYLPFKGNGLIHFDSHPDLLSPDINTEDVTDTDQLYSRTGIADWILPAVFTGHIGCIVWVKPPWAEQIPDGRHLLVVGKDKTSGQIRVATPLPYFLGEMLWVPKQDLINITEIPLDVVTLHPLPASSPHPPNSEAHSDPDHPLPDETRGLCDHESCRHGCLQSHSQSPPPSKRARVCPSCSAVAAVASSLSIATTTDCTAWILDIDLDFFSTGNPYRDIYSTDQYSLIQKLYRLEDPAEYSEEALCQCTSERQKQLSELKRLWCSEVPSLSSSDAAILSSTCGSDVTSGSTSSCKDRETDETLVQLTSGERNLVAEMKELLWKLYGDSFVDPDYLHTSGLVSDLPIHVSDAGEIAGLVKGLSHALLMVHKKPSLVTISRSTEDEYTPAHQVEDIQERVLHMLHSSLGVMADKELDQLTVHHHYLETPPCTTPPEASSELDEPSK